MSRRAAFSRRELLSGGFFKRLLEREEARPAAVAPLPGAERPEASAPASPPVAARSAPSGRHRRRARVIPVLRPPGAVSEAAFLDACTRCGDCISACPHGAITLAPARLRGAADTPMVDPAKQPCLLCEDTPCITACQPGALRPVPRIEMGVASIDTLSCLAHQGGFCSTCVEHCPEPGAIETSGGKPRVVTELCVGCGVCQHVCPAPMNAIRLMPTMVRS